MFRRSDMRTLYLEKDSVDRSGSRQHDTPTWSAEFLKAVQENTRSLTVEDVRSLTPDLSGTPEEVNARNRAEAAAIGLMLQQHTINGSVEIEPK